MLQNGILFLSIILIGFTYFKIWMMYLRNKKKKIENITGFDLAKEITANYNEINIVESKEILLSKYNLKRKVIRLTPKTYESNDIFTLSITSLLSGYSLTDIENNKYLQGISHIFKNITCISTSPILAILLSLFPTSSGDAKIAILLLSLILVYQYFFIQINTNAIQKIKEEWNNHSENRDLKEIKVILSNFLFTYNTSFVTTLILIIRQIVIILNF